MPCHAIIIFHGLLYVAVKALLSRFPFFFSPFTYNTHAKIAFSFMCTYNIRTRVTSTKLLMIFLFMTFLLLSSLMHKEQQKFYYYKCIYARTDLQKKKKKYFAITYVNDVQYATIQANKKSRIFVFMCVCVSDRTRQHSIVM